MVILISETTAFLFPRLREFFEWTLHKYLMHTPFWQYPFRAHARFTTVFSGPAPSIFFLM